MKKNSPPKKGELLRLQLDPTAVYQGDGSFVSGLGCGESWLKEAPGTVSGPSESSWSIFFFGLKQREGLGGVDALEGFFFFFGEGQRKNEEI